MNHANTIHASVAARMVILFTCGYVFAAYPLYELAELPRSFFEAHGVLRLFAPDALNILLQPWSLIFIQWSGLIGIVLAFRYPRIWAFSWYSTFLLILHVSLSRGYSHLNNAEITPTLLALCVCAEDARAWWSKKHQRTYQSALHTMATFFFLLTYTLTGAHRFAGGFSFFFHDKLLSSLVALSDVNHTFFASQSFTRHDLLYQFFNLGFLIVTWIEFLALTAWVSTCMRFLFLAVMLPFHLLAGASLGLVFIENCILMLLLLDLNQIHAWLRLTKTTTEAGAAD